MKKSILLLLSIMFFGSVATYSQSNQSSSITKDGVVKEVKTLSQGATATALIKEVESGKEYFTSPMPLEFAKDLVPGQLVEIVFNDGGNGGDPQPLILLCLAAGPITLLLCATFVLIPFSAH
ncbi:MAG: hypothetical protein ACLGGV_07165 [Bacteroidia bacterium]